MDIEIASKIATKLGKTLFVKDMDFEAIIPSVASGESDIGMAGLTVNDERLKTVDFSLGYYSSYQVITVRESTTLFDECKNAEDVENILKAQTSKYKIGTQNGTTGYMYSQAIRVLVMTAQKSYDKGYTTGALAMKDFVQRQN